MILNAAQHKADQEAQATIDAKAAVRALACAHAAVVEHHGLDTAVTAQTVGVVLVVSAHGRDAATITKALKRMGIVVQDVAP